MSNYEVHVCVPPPHTHTHTCTHSQHTAHRKIYTLKWITSHFIYMIPILSFYTEMIFIFESLWSATSISKWIDIGFNVLVKQIT